jgi:hypothetical protein
MGEMALKGAEIATFVEKSSNYPFKAVRSFVMI